MFDSTGADLQQLL